MSVSGDSYTSRHSSTASTTLSTQTTYLPHTQRVAFLPTAHPATYPRRGPAGAVGTAARPAHSRGGERGIVGRSAIGRRGAALVFPPSGVVRDEWDDDDNEAEGWDKVVLERELDIAIDESLLPSLADEHEMLPSQVHPSYPSGQPYKRAKPYVSTPKLSPLLHTNLALIGSAKGAKDGEASEAALQRPLLAPPNHLLLRAATDTASQSPDWPFKRYGPGPGGISALRRNERRRPHRPQRELWAEIALAELLPHGRERDPLKALDDDTRAAAATREAASDSEGEGDSSDALHWRTGMARAEKVRIATELRDGPRNDALQEQMERVWESRAPGGEVAAAARTSGWGVVRDSS